MSNRKKEKLWGTILGVITFVALIAGATYAWYSWSSGESILTGGTNCFTINYTAGNSIGSGTNSPAGLGVSDSYTGGLYTDIKMAISNTCSVKGVGTIKLTTSSFKNSDGTSAVSLISDGNTLKYVVATVTNPNTSSETVTPITGCSGSITDTGQKSICDFDLTNLASASATVPTYRVYVWLDGSNVSTNFGGIIYSGSLNASAAQKQE